MGEFVQLKRGNDWGREYLSPKPLTSKGMADARRGISFKDGDKVMVRFPDNVNIELEVKNRHHHTTVNDMGHVYPVNYYLPCVKVWVHGVETLLPLDAPGLEVWLENPEVVDG
jgi:hypothetical protein